MEYDYRKQIIDGVERACFYERELEQARAYSKEQGALPVYLIRSCQICGRELYGDLRYAEKFYPAICPRADHLNG